MINLMLEIISKEQFTEIPWKNGLGKTIEMAISDNDTVDSFDWRISQATVANDGFFSDFSGLERNLVLIEGEGITLTHDEDKQDVLSKLLEFANFDGGSKTFGELHNGTIVDLNIMTKADKYSTLVMTHQSANNVLVPSAQLVFIYSLREGLGILVNGEESAIDAGALVKITPKHSEIKVSGTDLIIVAITEK